MEYFFQEEVLLCGIGEMVGNYPNSNSIRFYLYYSYTRAAFRLVKYVYKLNKKKDHFPIFGICLGFETIMLALDKSRFRALSHFDHK